MAPKVNIFLATVLLLSLLAHSSAEVAFHCPSSDNQPMDDYNWQDTYNECVETYVSCKERHEGCEICEQLCLVAARDCELTETRDYLQNMAMACASGHFIEERLAMTLRMMLTSSIRSI